MVCHRMQVADEKGMEIGEMVAGQPRLDQQQPRLDQQQPRLDQQQPTQPVA